MRDAGLSEPSPERETEPDIDLRGNPRVLHVLVFTEQLNATCYITFERPLRLLHSQKKLNFAIATQRRVKIAGAGCWKRWAEDFEPDVVVMSRYALPYGPAIVDDFREIGVPVIYHIDDNLLEMPESLSEGVLKLHGAAEVIEARRQMLKTCSQVFASTPHLAASLAPRLPGQSVVHAQVSAIYEKQDWLPPRGNVIGYMGSRGHQGDLGMVVPAIERLMEERSDLRFEVFGSIAMPDPLLRFGDRVCCHSTQRSYPDFMKSLAGLRWGIGLAPLEDTPFNRCKTPTKYVEYTGAGIPCIASRVPVYGEVVPHGAAFLVDADWYGAIKQWLDDPGQTLVALQAAAAHCAGTFSPEQMAAQVQTLLVGTADAASELTIEVPAAHHEPLAYRLMQSSARHRTSSRLRFLHSRRERPGRKALAFDAPHLVLGDLAQATGVPSDLAVSLRHSPRSIWLRESHPRAYLLSREFRRMLNDRQLSWQEVMDAVSTGIVRRSILRELRWIPKIPPLLQPAGPLLARLGDVLSSVRSRLRPHRVASGAKRFLQRLRDRARLAYAMLTRHPHVERAGNPARARQRVLYVANSFLPTLQLCFVKPLQQLADADEVATELISQTQMKEMSAGRIHGAGVQKWLRGRFEKFDPTVVVFCRFSGPHAKLLATLARERGVPTIYHIDDDLLHVPSEIGEAKYRYHNDPARLETVRWLLENVDLVYCSTRPLLDRLREFGLADAGVAGRAHCSGAVLRDAPTTAPLKLGYMGIDHAHDFEVALPALVEVLQECPEVEFEIFGPMAVPEVLEPFGSRIRVIPPVPDYGKFLQVFATLDWAIGICPLADTRFNELKSNNKWVEYTSVGAAVVATRGKIYDECCSDGCGLLVSGREEWKAALLRLIREPGERLQMVTRAQAKLAQSYSVDELRKQVLEVFELGRVRSRLHGSPEATSYNPGSK